MWLAGRPLHGLRLSQRHRTGAAVGAAAVRHAKTIMTQTVHVEFL